MMDALSALGIAFALGVLWGLNLGFLIRGWLHEWRTRSNYEV